MLDVNCIPLIIVSEQAVMSFNKNGKISFLFDPFKLSPIPNQKFLIGFEPYPNQISPHVVLGQIVSSYTPHNHRDQSAVRFIASKLSQHDTILQNKGGENYFIIDPETKQSTDFVLTFTGISKFTYSVKVIHGPTINHKTKKIKPTLPVTCETSDIDFKKRKKLTPDRSRSNRSRYR